MLTHSKKKLEKAETAVEEKQEAAKPIIIETEKPEKS